MAYIKNPRPLKDYKFALYFQRLFICNLSVKAKSIAQAVCNARTEVLIRYPVKHKQVRLKLPYEPKIKEREEPTGIVVKMINEIGKVSYK